MANTCFPSGSLQYWYRLDRGCLHNQLIKTLGTNLLRASLSRNIAHTVFFMQKKGAYLVWPCARERGHWKSVHGIFQTPVVCFSVADPVLCPFVTTNPVSANYMLSPTSPSKSLNHSIFRTTSRTHIHVFVHLFPQVPLS